MATSKKSERGVYRINWKFSRRQLLAMYWWHDARMSHAVGFIADGTVRSGKTVACSLGFLMWSMESFSGVNFGLCGKTIKSFERNVLSNIKIACQYLGYTLHHNKSDNLLTISSPNGAQNFYYIFGGNDESSQDLIQGITLAGILFDEVVLMPESFVNQGIARCSVDGAKVWMNCNPEGTTHYIKRRFIDNHVKRGYIYSHFDMEDNLTLSAERRQFYEKQWTGLFYRRFILGEWCLADGLVYQIFNPDKMVFDGAIDYRDYAELIASYDYGIQNATAFLMMGYNVKAGTVDVIKGWSYSGRENTVQKTDDELYEDLLAFVGDCDRVLEVYGDPSATSFHSLIRKKKRFRDRNADNEVLDGISFVSQLMSMGQLRIHASCTDLIRELQGYAWDSEKSEREGRDVVLKVDDHSCDALRYGVYSYYGPKAKTLKLGYYSEG